MISTFLTNDLVYVHVHVHTHFIFTAKSNPSKELNFWLASSQS